MDRSGVSVNSVNLVSPMTEIFIVIAAATDT